MPGAHITAAQRQSYLAYRRQGLRQHEAMKLVGISRQSAHRIDASEGLLEAHPITPAAPYEPPPRLMPLETATRLLKSLQGVSDPQAIEAVVVAVKDVIPPEILADELKALDGPGLFPTGTDGVSDLPRKAPEAEDDPDGDRYGPLVPDLATRPRTWSPNDRRIDPSEGLPRADIRPGSKAWERRAQAIRAARKRPPASGGLVFYQP